MLIGSIAHFASQTKYESLLMIFFFHYQCTTTEFFIKIKILLQKKGGKKKKKRILKDTQTEDEYEIIHLGAKEQVKT